MQQFKVGDWVRHVSTNHILQITTLTSETINGYPLACYIPWQPNEGEWCLFVMNADEYSLRQWTNSNININQLKANMCEPFIGQLPSFLQEQS